jgi:hypothetical protein
MPFQCRTHGACVEVGNYISFSQASRYGASSLIRAQLRIHTFRDLPLFGGRNEDDVFLTPLFGGKNEDDIFIPLFESKKNIDCSAPLDFFEGSNEEIVWGAPLDFVLCQARPNDTRLALILLYHPCMHYKLGCVKKKINLLVKFVKTRAFKFLRKRQFIL